MKKILLVITLLVLAISGCMEKGPSEKVQSVQEIKTLAVKSADNLSTYGLMRSVDQIMKSNAPGTNKTEGNLTTVQKSIVSVNLTANKAVTDGSIQTFLNVAGAGENTSLAQITVYQAGNLTYINENGNWISLRDPRPAEAIWGNGNISQVKALADRINRSQEEIIGSEKIGGEEAYELKIQIGKDDYIDLYNTAYSIANKLNRYTDRVPSINITELNQTYNMERQVWISKETYLPLKYHSSMSFKITPIFVERKNIADGRVTTYNQSVRLGQISVDLETTDQYQNFNKPVEINVPGEALATKPINPNQSQIAAEGQ
jgi:hypothetical protein